jgi:hypothetical protein
MVTEQQGYDYFNANYWNVVPMSEETFRAHNWIDVQEFGPTSSGEMFLVGVHGDGTAADYVVGLFDKQRLAGVIGGGAQPI